MANTQLPSYQRIQLRKLRKITTSTKLWQLQLLQPSFQLQLKDSQNACVYIRVYVLRTYVQTYLRTPARSFCVRVLQSFLEFQKDFLIHFLNQTPISYTEPLAKVLRPLFNQYCFLLRFMNTLNLLGNPMIILNSSNPNTSPD